MKTPDEDPHPNGDGNRYGSAKGWSPNDKYEAKHQKLIDDHRRAHPEDFCNESMFETRPANDAGKGCGPAPRNPQLFDNLWRRGELAVLFAEPGIGKSILAVQIAESIARGYGSSECGTARVSEGAILVPPSRPRSLPQSVLYLDLERTGAQFGERYTIPSPIPGTKPVRYRFSSHFSRTGIRQGAIEVPDIFGGDLSRYYRYSIESQLGASPAEVRIIDSLGHLDPKGGPRSAIRYLRGLKLTAATTGQSMLVIANAKLRRRHAGTRASLPAHGSLRPIELCDLAYPEIAEIADSIFALQRTTLGPEWRYIKHLTSGTPAALPADHVYAYQIARMEDPFSPATEPTEPTEYGIVHSLRSPALALPPSPETEGPFLGFQYQGEAAESDMLRDYAAEAARNLEERAGAHRKQLRRLACRTATDELIEGMMNGSYLRYLKGE